MDRNILTIEKAVLSDLPRVVEFVVNWLESQGLGKYSFPLETAVDEASTNVIKYAYHGEGGFFRISCELQGHEIVVTISDRGKQFDPNSVPLPDVDTDLENRRVGGLGIYMMKKMMDEVKYSFDAKRGNRLEMRKTTAGPGDAKRAC
jgi:anti-sigma regulatory factor (Ser/Thr protein kinase)